MKKLLIFALYIFLLFCNISYAVDCEFLSKSACEAYKEEADQELGRIVIAIAVILSFWYFLNVITKYSKKRKKSKKIKEKIKIEKEASSSDLGESLKRLKKMYNDGNLNKAEFEKAKNKLLK